MARPNAPMKRQKRKTVLTEVTERVQSRKAKKKAERLLKQQRQSAKIHKYRESDCLV